MFSLNINSIKNVFVEDKFHKTRVANLVENKCHKTQALIMQHYYNTVCKDICSCCLFRESHKTQTHWGNCRDLWLRVGSQVYVYCSYLKGQKKGLNVCEGLAEITGAAEINYTVTPRRYCIMTTNNCKTRVDPTPETSHLLKKNKRTASLVSGCVKYGPDRVNAPLFFTVLICQIGNLQLFRFFVAWVPLRYSRGCSLKLG